MQVVLKDGTALNYADAQWIEYRDGAALLMKLANTSRRGDPPAIVAVLSINEVLRVDTNPFNVIQNPTAPMRP